MERVIQCFYPNLFWCSKLTLPIAIGGHKKLSLWYIPLEIIPIFHIHIYTKIVANRFLLFVTL